MIINCVIMNHLKIKDHKLALGYFKMNSGVIDLIEFVPHSIIVVFSSFVRISNAWFIPYSPNARLNRNPRPIKTKSAPIAKHLKISEPVLTPPSM